jgi:hypothetical protein
MIRYYTVEIPVIDMMPPGGVPTALGFLFINNVYFNKICVVRSTQHGSTFKLGYKIAKNACDDFVLYANGKKYYFIEDTEDAVVTNDYHGGTELGFTELRQDMLAYRYNISEFPELTPYL